MKKPQEKSLDSFKERNPAMDADEKLMALKKAYADIIMDISKEAAARVMACEKKSARSYHELKATKEEGMRMLMRLKKMMDAQRLQYVKRTVLLNMFAVEGKVINSSFCLISEAEAAALNRQKKIEELEAQLQEAEDIVRDLRDELTEVKSELERINSPQMVKPENTDTPQADIISSYQFTEYLPPNKSSLPFGVTVPYQGQRNECRKCYNKIVCTCGAYIRNRDLPSIILRGKGDGLYRNGCTQRIRAYERDVSDGDLGCSEETDRGTEEKNDVEPMQIRHTSEAPAYGGKIPSELEKKLFAENNFGCFQSFSRKRKRDVRRKKALTPLAGNECSLLQNPSEIGPILSRDKGELKTQLDCRKDSENDANTVGTCDSTTPVDAATEKLVPLGLAAEPSEILPNDSKLDAGNADEPLHGLESNPPDIIRGLSNLPVRERVIKYTFQRKRKRQALVVSEVNSSCKTEKKIGDEESVIRSKRNPSSAF